MKPLILLAFYLLCSATLYAQVVTIDSIPTTGVLLQQGWRWYAGDHSAFANPNFDDTKWPTIDPTQDIIALPQVRDTPVSWFRIRLRLKDSTYYQKLALAVKQTGATELYLNGKPLYQFGKIAANRTDTEGYDPSGQAIALPLEMGKENVLAVRFAFPDIFLTRAFYLPNSCLKVAVTAIENTAEAAGYLNILALKARLSGMFKSGIMLLLAVLHFWFFLTFPKQKANLFFSLYAFITLLILLGENLANLYIPDVNIRNMIFMVDMLLHPLTVLFAFVAVYSLLNPPRTPYFWATIAVTILSIPLMLRPYFTGYLFGIFVPMLLACVGIFIVAWKAVKEGNQSAVGIYVAVIVIFVSYAAYFWGINFIERAWVKSLWSEITFDATVLALPVALSYYLGLDFAQNKAQIEQNFLDFQRLATEKEANLLRQNAELQAALLQGQATERKRLADDLHDSLGSTMSALRWSMEAINPQKLSPQEQEVYRHVQNTIAQAHDQVRLLSHNLLPEELEKQGLWEALRQLIGKLNRNTPVKWTLTLPHHPPRFDAKMEFELYSIVLELTNNTLKHAQATEGNVMCQRIDDQWHITVSDNGVGMTEKRTHGKGMNSVESRVKSLNGQLHIHTQAGEGTRFEVWV